MPFFIDNTISCPIDFNQNMANIYNFFAGITPFDFALAGITFSRRG